MATQIVIANEESIHIDGTFHIEWADKGNAMPSLPDTIHYVVWNNHAGQNEVQHKDASTNNMTGNTDLNATSDVVGSTTISDLLTWAETRKAEIIAAKNEHMAARGTASDAWVDAGNERDTFEWTKTWDEYDPNYS